MKTINLKLICLALLLSSVWLACQKNDRHTEVFDPAAAKEWYYGSFKRSAEWSARNATTDGKQLPDWNKGVYKRTANGETVEFPLVKDKSKVSVIKSNLPAGEVRQLAAATITKVLFTRHNDGRHTVRVMEYIPDAAYLARHQYDISHLTAGNIDADFSGMIVARNWAGKELARHLLEKGRIKMRLRISLTETCPPGSIQVTEYARDCESHLYGDGMLTYQCGEWYPTGNEWCYADDEPIEDPCEDPEAAMCYCQLTGECGSGGGEEPDPIPEILNNIQDPCIRSMVESALNAGCKNEITTYINTNFATSQEIHLRLNDNNIIVGGPSLDAQTTFHEINGGQLVANITFNTTSLANATREYIVATMFHEMVHAYINIKYPALIQNAQEHQKMAEQPRFNMMRDALMEVCPNLSLQDATDLTWGGLYATIAFQQLPPAERERIFQRNQAYKNGNSGTPC